MPPMNSYEPASFPNSEALSSYHPGNHSHSVLADADSEYKVTPNFSRYRRRCSVTRYSLDKITPTATNKEPTSRCNSKGETEEEEKTTLPHALEHYGRRCTATRFSLHQQAAAIPETRSLSPVPIARRGSITTYTAVLEGEIPWINLEEGGNEKTTTEEHPPLEVQPTPRRRFNRRCSVTKYSFDEAEVVAKTTVEEPRFQRRCSVTKYNLEDATITTPDNEVVVQVQAVLTVEEPVDTVDSIEHQQMLASDTIESSGAGDLIVGWNQAAVPVPTTGNANHLVEERSGYHEMGQLICGFGARKPASSIEEEEKWSPTTLEGKSSYFIGVLSKPFAMTPVWVQSSLQSEVPVMSITTPPSA